MTTPTTTTTVLMVAGMRDRTCRQVIAHALKSIAGVKAVDVVLHRASATIVHGPQCGVAEFVQTIERVGYAAEPVPEGRKHGSEAE